MERINLLKQWRDGKRRGDGRTNIYHPGFYVVGKHVTKDLAAKWLKEGLAVKAPEPVRLLPGAKSKGPAPENKALDTRNLTTKME